MTIEWGELRPSAAQKAQVEARLVPLVQSSGTSLGLRLRGQTYEAELRVPTRTSSATLRLHGDELAPLLERAAELLAVLAGKVTP